MSEDVESTGTTRVRFRGISPRAYEHPADRAAMAALRAVPGVASVLKAVAGMWNERAERLFTLASTIRVGQKQYPKLNRLRVDCAETLDLDTVPDLYVARHPVANAYAIGIDKPFIVLTTGIVEALDNESLRVVVGHEVGHILSGHSVLRTLLMRLLRLQANVQWMALGALGLRAVIAALMEWYRKAELTGDRAGLLCSQDPAAALRAHVYLAGGTSMDDIDIPEFMAQAKEYEEVDDIRDSILKLMTVETMSHPFSVVRAAQLQRWAASEEYRAILAGDYLRREDDQPTSTMMDDVRAAGQSYKESWSSSTDPLAKVLSDVGEAVSGAAGRVFNRFGGRGDTQDGADGGQ
ncbi:M48 family metallopeptidase [Actinophytocola oryzae]|uniref:Zn-dependent protease with chaperone function n=1 Tax=Actinophytocola oryzae TaxID=502181 RepID=A0A4R7USZ6_9PSEU|nr:M48 family metallopeptidase [Actinophytocola oryzae]TDV39709.1 Zn-dependent protease with chaperone function [Actinophytocola oryzae]